MINKQSGGHRPSTVLLSATEINPERFLAPVMLEEWHCFFLFSLQIICVILSSSWMYF